jgi:hypothetical protein
MQWNVVMNKSKIINPPGPPTSLIAKQQRRHKEELHLQHSGEGNTQWSVLTEEKQKNQRVA